MRTGTQSLTIVKPKNLGQIITNRNHNQSLLNEDDNLNDLQSQITGDQRIDNIFIEATREVAEELSNRDPSPSKKSGLDIFMDASKEVSEELSHKQTAQEQTPAPRHRGLLEQAGDAWHSMGGGIIKAGLETKDFLVGEPAEEDKHWLRREIEAKAEERAQRSIVNSITMDVSQFVTGMLGAGKITAPLKLAKLGKAGVVGNEVLKGAIAGAVVIDPHEERLSNLVQQYPALQNPVTEYLAADPNDSDAEGRFKNALEGIGFDLALAGTFAGAAKALKLFRNGDEAPAKEILEKIAVDPEAPSPKPDVDLDDAAKKAIEGPQVESKPSEHQPIGSGGAEHSHSTPRLSSVAQEPPQEVMERLLKESEDDLAVYAKFGSREAAEVAGYRFGTKSRLPWAKLRASSEVREFVEEAATYAKTVAPAIDGTVFSDARVKQLVDHRAQVFGEDPDLVLGKIRSAGSNATNMVADMEAGMLIANKMANDTYDVVYKIRNGMLDEWNGDIAKAEAELKARLTATLDTLGAASEMRSAAGRALRRNRSEFQVSKEALDSIQSLDGEKLVDAIYLTKGDLSKIKDIAHPSFLSRIADEASFSLVNSLLWLYPTHVVNFTSNLFMLAARPTEKLVGSLLMGSKGRPVRQQAAKEYGYTLASLGDAWEAASEAFMRGDSVLTPHAEEFFENGRAFSSQQRIPWKPIENVGDVLENLWKAVNYRTVVGFPTRALGTFDELMKTARYRGVVQAQAHVEGASHGLSGRELGDYVKTKLDDSFDSQGRGVNPAAIAEAQATTFQQELLPKTLGSTLQNARASFRPLEFILPFIKTPTNVIRYSWKMTPGLNMLQKEYRQAISGGKGAEAQAQSIGQMLMGTVGISLAAHLALSGRVTGGGPSNPASKAELQATGWKPYSIVTVKEDGSKHYFPIGRFDPVGMVFGIAADIVDAHVLHPNAKDNQDAIGATALALAQNFSDRSFLQNFNQFLRAMSEPDDNLERYLGTMAGNIVPGSSAIRGYVNQDPYLRDARGFVDNMLRNMPGYSETLPPRRDAFGDPVWKRIGLTATQEFDLVEEEHNRIIEETGHGISVPTPHKHGVDLRDIKLEDGRNAFDVYQQYAAQPMPKGKSLREALAQVIQSKQYSKLVDGDISTQGTKLYAIAGVVATYRKLGLMRLLKESKVVREAATQKKREVKAAIISKRNQTEGKGTAKGVLEAIGIKN